MSREFWSMIDRLLAHSLIVVCLGGAAAATVRPADPGEEAAVDYNREVRPLLSRHCFPCHGPDEGHREMDLRLDRREDAVADRHGHRVIAPGDLDGSELWYRITTDSEFERMPPEHTGRTLAADEVDLLRRWIEQGAVYDRHWAFDPPTRPVPPSADSTFDRNPIDAFTRARMREHGLEPAAPADRATLIRRLSLDLCGLPPSPAEVDAFLADARPDAYERLVERLLAKPAYGERWARVWLDLARYADSSGYGSDPLRTIWRYRDWVIDAYNRNLPYDQFTLEQLAGDLLPDATMEQQLATAFHRNTMTNTEGGTDDEEFRVAAVKDRVNTTGQVWLGLTLGCAQCHSHKFDPVSQREYYSLFAFFNQTEDFDQPDERPRLDTPTPEQQARRRELDRELAAVDAILAAPGADRLTGFEAWAVHAAAVQDRWVEVTPPSAAGRETAPPVATLDPRGDPGAGRSLPITTPAMTLSAIRLTLPGPADLVDGRQVHLYQQADDGVVVHGRRVRVRLPGAERILSLAEVEVWSGGVNLAREGVAAQSSTAYDGPAARAIDGNTSGVFDEGSVTHTAISAEPWWEVDLRRDAALDSIVLWNRTDGDLETRLTDAEVQVLTEDGTVVWSSGGQPPPRPRSELRPGRDDRLLGLRTATTATVDGRDPGAGSEAPAQELVFELATPIELAAGTRLRLEGPWPRDLTPEIAFTDAPSPVRALPSPIARALAKEHRDADQVRRMQDHYATFAPELEPLREQRRRLAEERAEPVVTTPIMRERPAEQRRATHVLVKGNFLVPGEAVAPDVPAALNPWPAGEPRNRLGLARWLVSRDNPLTARVAVNRLWARLFGRGLVESEEDFGTQGALPTHPALLDWLAVEFMDGGWDQKALLKCIVQSATYRQSSHVSGDAQRTDPQNRWLARGARFRLEAEMVRDQALAVSGLLSDKMYGPSVFPPQPEGLWQAAFNSADRHWATSPGEDRHRRALYTFLRRTVPYPSMATFDAPSREICTVRRTRTNTPLQSLVTLNDPVYVEAAQALGRRILREGGAQDRERLQHGWHLVTAQTAEPQRIAPLEALLEASRAFYRSDAEAARRMATDPLGPLPEGLEVTEAAAWTVIGNVLLNLDLVLTRG